MDYTSLQSADETLGEYVEALASAHRRVVAAKEDIQRYEDLKLRLVQAGQFEAAEATLPRIRDLELGLGRLEVLLTVASHSVRNAFDAVTADHAPYELSFETATA